MEHQEGQFKGHTACVVCASSDGLAVYEKTDEKGNDYLDGYCYACETYIKPEQLGFEIEYVDNYDSSRSGKKLTEEDIANIMAYDVRGVKERRIKKEYAGMYDMRVSYDEETGEINRHYYPVTRDNKIVGFKVRQLPKTFYSIGDTKGCQLFGQHLFDEGGELSTTVSKKFLFITEGELDCIALQQALSDNSKGSFLNAVVSLPTGANLRAVKANYKFISQFENIILMLDNDEKGEQCAQDIAKILPIGKVKVGTLPLKDPCDMLKAGRGKEMASLMWNAQPISPAGIVSAKDLWDEVNAETVEPIAYYPYQGLNNMVGGIYESTIVTLTAGSGVAKTTFMRDILYNLLNTTGHNIGALFLEEPNKKTIRMLMGNYLNKLLGKPGVKTTLEEREEAFEKVAGSDRVWLYDGYGENDLEAIENTIRFYAKALDCKFIFLDHISIMVSGGESKDERKEVDRIMTRFAKLVQELNITLFLVSHLTRVKEGKSGKGHEEGAMTGLNQLRSSGAIAQLSDIVIGIERNGQHKDPIRRNTSTLRVLKSREFGELGVASHVYYDPTTGRIKEVIVDEEEDYEEHSLEELDY